MPKFHKIIQSLSLILLMVFLLQLIPQNALASSGDYYISNIVINAEVKENGDIAVSESHDYVFQGSFNGMKREVGTNGSDGIANISAEVYKNGVNEKSSTEINKDGDAAEIKIYSKSDNETKNFKINYAIKNAVTKFSDLGEFKWDFYKNDSDVKINKITVFVSLPEDITNKVKYYGEGPKRGISSLEDKRTIKLELNNMQKDDFIGISTYFPSEWINTSKIINMKRDAYYEKQQKERNKNIMIASLVIFIIAVLTSSFIYLKRRRRQEAIKAYREGHVFFREKYYFEIPNALPPALVSVLVDNEVNTKDFLAEIIYLSNMGAIKFLKNGFAEEDFTKVCFKINEAYDKNMLMEYEEFLIKWLKKYSNNGSISLERLKDKSSELSFTSKYVEWKKLILKQAENMNFYTTIEGKKILTNIYENEKLKWKAFRNYLDDFRSSELNEQNKKLDERVLPYAISLEASENFIDNFKDTSEFKDSMFMSYWFLSYYTTTYTDDFNMNNSGSNSDSSSGNFSGGSGGNLGGGGGGSAF